MIGDLWRKGMWFKRDMSTGKRGTKQDATAMGIENHIRLFLAFCALYLVQMSQICIKNRVKRWDCLKVFQIACRIEFHAPRS